MANAVILGDTRILQPGSLRWLRTLGWMVALVLLVGLTFNLVAKGVLHAEVWASGEPYTTRAAAGPLFNMIAVMAGALAVILAYWGAVWLGENRPVTELALRPLVPETLGGMLIGGGQMAAIIAFMWAAGWVSVTETPITQIYKALQDTAQSSIIEEIFIRLVVFRLLWRAFGVWPALLLSAALFGALHLFNPDSTLFAAVCLILGEGVGMGLYMLTGRIWMSIGAHAGWNFTQGWILGAVVSGQHGFAGGPFATQPVAGIPEYLSGGGFGPEASLAGLIIPFAASIIILRLAWKRGKFLAE